MCRTILASLIVTAAVGAARADSEERGQLLYATHCIECHSVQMHWRSQRLARDWDTLREQVARWQATARLQWSAEDIEAVTRHLNNTIYRFPRSQAQRTPAAGEQIESALQR